MKKDRLKGFSNGQTVPTSGMVHLVELIFWPFLKVCDDLIFFQQIRNRIGNFLLKAAF